MKAKPRNRRRALWTLGAALAWLWCGAPQTASATADLHVDPGRQTPWDNCTACHGADLLGGFAGVACTQCHNDFQAPDPPPQGHHTAGPGSPIDTAPRQNPQDNCSICHGNDLTGGIGPSCFSCHDQLWPGGGGGNSPPNVDPGGPYSGAPGQPVLFDASGTTDPDGDSLTYIWSFGDGSLPVIGDSPTAEHTYNDAGVYTVMLTVDDGVNFPVVVQFDVTTAAATNEPPTADPGGPYQGVAGQAVQLDGSASSDPDGDALTYEWDFGDGSAAGPNPSPTVSHAYQSPGTYTVVLRVSDGVNTPVEAQTTVEIAEPPSGQLSGRWRIRLPLLPASGEVSFEPFAGFLLIEQQIDGQSSFGVGLESDRYVFWFDLNGAFFLGVNYGQSMAGVVYNYRGADTVWLAEPAPAVQPDPLLGDLFSLLP